MTWTLAKYFLRRTFWGLLIAFGIVFALLSLVDFVEATRDVDADSSLTNLDLLGLTLLKTPSLLEQTLPFIALFAAIGTLNGLNRRSELIAARAAGLSAWRYLRPSVGTSVALGLIWVGLINPLAARAEAAAEQIRIESQGQAADFNSDIWLRDAAESGRAVILAKGFNDAQRQLLDVTYFGFAPGVQGDRFVRRIDAESLQFLPSGDWQFRTLREWAGGSYGDLVTTLALPSSLTERELLDQIESQRRQTVRLPAIWQLPARIASQERAGYSTILPRMKFWKLASLPLLLAAMTLIGANVSMRLSREGGTWQLILTGAVLGFGVYFATVFVEAFGEVGTIPPLVATWTVPLLALVGSLYGLARLEDG